LIKGGDDIYKKGRPEFASPVRRRKANASSEPAQDFKRCNASELGERKYKKGSHRIRPSSRL